jgi:hypothetical protein
MKSTKIQEKRGRNKLPPDQVKHKLWIHIEKSIIDFFGGKFEANALLKELILQEYEKRKQQ